MIDVLSLMILSSAIGFLGSLTGLGGGSILVPMLMLLGVPIKYAIAAGMVVCIATSSGSAASYVDRAMTNVKVAMYLELFTVIGGIVGATVTSFISAKLLYFFFAAFLMTSFLSLRGLHEELPKVEKQDRISTWLNLEGAYFDEALGEKVEYKLTNALPGGLGMLVAGLAAGMLGIGAGGFKVTVMELILKMPSKVSSTTSSFIIGMTALASITVYMTQGLIHLDLVTPVAIGTIIGAMMGARILNRLKNVTVRYLFLAIVSYLVIQMLYKGVTSQW